MQIFKIKGSQAFKAEISNKINLDEFLAKNKDFVKVEEDLPAATFYKYSAGVVSVDTDKEDVKQATALRNLYASYLEKTDFLMLLDNPMSLSLDEIRDIKEFRQNLRNCRTNLKQVISGSKKLSEIKLVEISDFINKFL